MDQPLCTSDLMAGSSNSNINSILCNETLKLNKYTTSQPKSPQIPASGLDLEEDDSSAVDCQTSVVPCYNGIINNLESYSTDEELEAIENQSKANLTKNIKTNNSEKLVAENNQSEFACDGKFTSLLLTPFKVKDLSPIAVLSGNSSSKAVTSPIFCYPDDQLDSDTNISFTSSDYQENLLPPVKNQAEHMLHAVREINTPWAKDLEERLAKEIKLDGLNKRDLNMNGQEFKPDSKEVRRKCGGLGNRELGNLMKAMVEIGTPWASEIQHKNYLPQRSREKVNYKITCRQKKDESTQKITNISNSISPKPVVKVEKKLSNSIMVLNEKLPKCAPNQTKAVNIKSDTKKKKVAQKLLKKAVGASQKGKISDKKISLKLKKSTSSSETKGKDILKVKKTIVKTKKSVMKKKIRIAVKNGQKKSLTKDKSKVTKINAKKPAHINSKMSLLDSLKKNKTVKVSKNCKLPHSSSNKVPSSEKSSSGNVGSVLVMKNFLSNSTKFNKPTKNNIIVSNLKNVEKVTACISSLHELPTAKQRQSNRQQVHSTVFKEIGVRKYVNLLQVTFLNRHNAAYLGVQALKELKNVFFVAKQDPTCRLVLLNGSGRVFCSGIDLSSICTRDSQKNITELTHALRDFLKSMLTFPKPIIAGVNGSAVGLGATMLPICDLVYASDKATFSTPYVKLSQVPEGGASFSFAQILGPAIASDMLLNGRILTAQEACQYGLVSQVMWPSQFMETLFPKVLNLASESSQGMEATKQLMKAGCKLQLDTHIDKECTLLNIQWNSQACQKAIMNAFHNRLHLST